MAEEVFETVNKSLTRVGKKEITDPQVLRNLQMLCPDKEIVKAVACRGTERTIAPPINVTKHVAPFRKALVCLRSSGEQKMEANWENWSILSQRQIIRKSHSAKINITVFGRNPSAEAGSPAQPSQVKTPPPQQMEFDREPSSQSQEVPDEPQVKMSMQHGLKFQALSKEEQEVLIRLHKNLGHPSNEKLSLALSQRKYRAGMAHGALDMHCDVCAQSQKPRHARPAALKDNLEFNSKVYIDGIKWTNSQGQSFHFYHVIDAGSNFHVALQAPSRTSASAIEFLLTSWINWAGPPTELVVDSATEFNSEEFQQFLQKCNVRCVTTNPESHWQMGKAERHGAFVQNMLDKLDKAESITTYPELQLALAQCTHAKNTLSVRRGYSPELIVFGRHSRLPGSICGDELVPAHSLADSETQTGQAGEFLKSLKLRERARVAFHQADNENALRRAALRRSCPHRGRYDAGEWVMGWKENVSGGKWTGPQRVVVQDGQNTVWTSMHGKLFRHAPEQVRPVTASESTDIPPYETIPEISEIQQQINQQHRQESIMIPPENGDNDLEHEPDIPEARLESDRDDPPTAGESAQQPDFEPSPAVSREESQREAEESSPNDASQTQEEETLQFLCCEEPSLLTDTPEDSAWRAEFECTVPDQFKTKAPTELETWVLLATQAKKQRTEVRLSTLTPDEKREFDLAKEKEIQNWIQTGTIAKVLKDQIPAEQILRCRWILTWKPLDKEDQEQVKRETGQTKMHKAKARLVVLGYLDPKIEEIPRDSH